MIRRTIAGCFLGAVLVGLIGTSEPAKGEELWKETPAQRDARMQWWRDARFGMFIHWGLYAIPAGEWDGKPIAGIGEWIMDRANIPVADYEQLAKQFNPTRFDAAEWVRIAKDAGVKYIVITSKHHDGFCLFDTKATDWDVVDASPYGKDLLIQLSNECRKQGIKFCTYYSIMDWHHPAQYRGSDKRYNPTKIHDGRKTEYMDFMKQQLKELLDTCNPEVLWFDGEWPDWYTEPDAREIYNYLRTLKPELIINNRVGKGRKGMEGLNKGDQEYVGDFGTPEQQIPATGLAGVDWESCMTMNDTWGFKKDDHKWKSTEMLIRNLIDIASKGGNYLLNVGPTAEGLIPAPSVERLEAIGKWMKVSGESIYGTQASPFAKTPWGRCTQKALEGGKTRLYLHVFDWPADGKLTVPVKNKVLGAECLGVGKLDAKAADGSVVIALPEEAPDKIATVIVLDVEGAVSSEL
ncbi:MAG: alpha-L-fucosidase [Planctomycetaceae bacterium]|nr:alpha-L-fucosidase [Planctomycetaceae bacterium]